MVWVIPTFPDQSVSLASEKWLRNNDKKCYFPKTNILRKLKNEADVDTKSEKWSLHPCRLLFEGQRFATYKEAREAEKIAQNHSTMASFQDSYLAKQKARKRPNVYNSSSSSENDDKDFKNIKKLAKLDAGINLNDKKYEYNRNFNDNHSPLINGSRSTKKVDYHSETSDESDDHHDNWSIISGATNKDSNNEFEIDDFSENEENGSSNNVDNEGNVSSNDVDNEENVSSNDVDNEENVSSNDVDDEENVSSNNIDKSLTINESDFHINMDNNLESTEQLPSPTNGYDFNEDRRLVRLEKLLTHVCQELVVIKADLKDIKKRSGESEIVAKNMASICKDLSVEVFACTAEIKKRNGMFTDVLVPDIKLPIKRSKQYEHVELALGRHKIVDNLIKFLASTINEAKEKQFIRTSLKVIFGLKFFCTKVWWKKMPKRVLIKNSQILHCMRESFKIKFGLNEPKKTDKEIDKLIYKVSRNVKDIWRKTQKKNEKDEVTIQDDDNWNAMERKGKRKNRVSDGQDEEVNPKRNTEEQVEGKKKDTKKSRKTETQADEALTGEKDMRASEVSDEYTRGAEESYEEKKAKKAAKKAKKAKQAAEEASRATEENSEERKAKKAAKKAAKRAAREEPQEDGMPTPKKPKKSKK